MKNLDEIVISPKGFKGFTFKRVYGDDKYYIYEQIKTESDIVYGYQLFERRTNSQYDCESWPGPEARNAWQHFTLEEALNKIKTL